MLPTTSIVAATNLCLVLAADADSGAAAGSGATAYDARFWLIVLAAMALAPFLLTMVTSFVKLVVVGSIIRTALGTPQVPPTQVITGLALILSVHVMWPVGAAIYQDYQRLKAEAVGTEDSSQGSLGDHESPRMVLERAAKAAQPALHEFLLRHSREADIELFEVLNADLQKSYESARTDNMETQAAHDPGSTENIWDAIVHDVTVVVPAFVLSELTEAFQIGFIIFVPFLIIDLVVSNLLLAMGMMMLQPTTISLPLKLLLFVLVDGWRLIIENVLLGYT